MKLRQVIRRVVRTFFPPDPVRELVKAGLVVGCNFHLLHECIIDPSHCWLIEIGDDVSIAPRVHILAHDGSTKRDLGYTRIGRVKIGNRVFIGAGSIIMPGVTIGDCAVIGAGSVVTKDIPSGSVAAGNPARVLARTEEFLNRRQAEIAQQPVFGLEYTVGHNVGPELKRQMIERLDRAGGCGYVV